MVIQQKQSCNMSNYTPEEVKMLIDLFKSTLPKKAPPKKFSDGKPILNKPEKTIRYLEQRRKFFNPTKQMLEYIINVAEKSDLDKVLIEKMKEDLPTKR